MFEVLKILLESDKFQQEITEGVQTWFEKGYAYRIYNPGAERVNAKIQYILHIKWTVTCILCIHQKWYKLDEGIVLIFVSEKKSAITFGEGCMLLCYDRASCKTACGWWVILYKYVLIKNKKIDPMFYLDVITFLNFSVGLLNIC